MKLLKLRCRNIATYEEVDIDFEKLSYPVFVMGNTGAGKTTLFVDAITAALYGYVYGEKRVGFYKEFVMQGKNRGVVELTFEVDGRKYYVRRVFDRKGSSTAILRMIYPEEKIIATGSDNVRKEVERLIGLKFEGLMNSAVVRQGEVYEFIEMKPSDRRNILQEILKIKFDEILEKLKEKLSKLKNQESKILGRIEMLRQDISKEKGLISELEDARRQIPQIRREIDKLQREIDELRKKKDGLQRKLGEIKSKIDQLEKIEKDLQEIMSRKNELEEEIKKIQEEAQRYPQEAINRIDELDEKISEVESIKMNIELRRKSLEDYQKKLKNYRRLLEIEQTLKEMSSLHAEYEEVRTKIDSFLSEIKRVEALADQTRDALKKLDAAEAICPVCGSPLPPEKKAERSQHLSLELKDLEHRRKELEKEIERLKLRRAKLESKISEINRLRGELDHIRRDLGDEKPSEDELKKLESEIEELRQKKEEMLKEISTLLGTSDLRNARILIRKIRDLAGKLREIKSKEELIKVYERRIEELKQRKAEIEDLITEYDRLKNQINNVELQISTKERTLNELTSRKASLESKIHEISKQLADIEKKKKELKEYEAKREELELNIRAYELLIKDVFSPGALPTELMREFLEFIEAQANEYLELFGQDIKLVLRPERTAHGTKSVHLEAYAGGYKRNIKTFSGGETTLIGFAIRLAIGKLLAQTISATKRPRFLIIDEGFGPLDSEKRELVADALAKLYASGEYEQIILISHQQDLKNSAVFRTVVGIYKDHRGISHVEYNP